MPFATGFPVSVDAVRLTVVHRPPVPKGAPLAQYPKVSAAQPGLGV